MSSQPPHPPHKSPRVLACVLCQNRKIKCDRKIPCFNCSKAGAKCVPSTPAPARKRRRPNQDLQERLARCEELLKQYTTASASPTGSEKPLKSLSAPSSLPAAAKNGETNTPMSAASDSQITTPQPRFKLIHQDGVSRFMDSQICGTVFEELQAMRNLLESPDSDDSIAVSPEELAVDNNADLILSLDLSNTTIEDLLPDPIHVFRLWQIYIDRVNPLTKIIHVPTVQPHVLEMTTNMSNVSLDYQALLFSIMSMATFALEEQEVVQLLGMSRDRALQTFNTGTKAALIRFNYLKNYNMVSLQALCIHLLSLENRIDTHTAWIMSATSVRLAQKMGYHHDGEKLKLTPYETEMRRRIWWQLYMHDAKLSMFSGLTAQNSFNIKWDTKVPSNVNDADLFPGSPEPIRLRNGPTEMIFVLLMCQFTSFKTTYSTSDDDAEIEAAILGQSEDMEAEAKHNFMFARYRKKAEVMEKKLLELEENSCDPTAGNAHIAAKVFRPHMFRNLDEMLMPMREQPEWGTEIFGPKDNLFRIIVNCTKYRIDLYEKMAELCTHTRGVLADRGWEAIEATYRYHPELFDLSIKTHFAQAQIAVKAWKAREASFAQVGWPLETPAFMQRLGDLLSSGEGRSSGVNSTTATPFPRLDGLQISQQNQSMPGLEETIPGDFLDMPPMNWDMLVDLPQSMNPMPNPIPNQFMGGPYTNYGLGNMNFNINNMRRI